MSEEDVAEIIRFLKRIEGKIDDLKTKLVNLDHDVAAIRQSR